MDVLATTKRGSLAQSIPSDNSGKLPAGPPHQRACPAGTATEIVRLVRSVKAETAPEQGDRMQRYRVDIAGSVRAYGSVLIEAASIEAANAIADEIVRRPRDARFPVLHPDWNTLFEREVLHVTPVAG